MTEKLLYLIVISVATLSYLLLFSRDNELAMKTLVPAITLLLLFMVTILYFMHAKPAFIQYFISKYYYFKKKKTQDDDDTAKGDATDIELWKLPQEYIILKKYGHLDILLDYIVIGPTGTYVVILDTTNGTVSKMLCALTLNDVLPLDPEIKRISALVSKFSLLVGRYKYSLKTMLCFTKARVDLQHRELFDGVLPLPLTEVLQNISEAPTILSFSDIQAIFQLLSKDSKFSSCRNFLYKTA